MAYRTRSSSSYKKNAKKGQFFVLTTVAIVTILFFVGRWMGPLIQADTSSIAQAEELFTFDNIQEKSSIVVKSSESCDDLNYNIQEYKSFIDNFAKEKNYKISLTYSITPNCEEFEAAIVEFILRILSERVDARSSFSVTWP